MSSEAVRDRALGNDSKGMTIERATKVRQEA